MAAEARLAQTRRPTSPPHAVAAPRRDLRLDACRGLALWCIFLDHVPDNIGSWVTLQHYGFSDTTEVFMFVSGFTCALAYGEVLRAHGWTSVVAHTLRRSFEIYVAFLMLILACAVMAYLAGDHFLDDSNTRILLQQPGPALLHALVLQYRPVNSDVLPTFVLFHATVAPLLLCLRRAPNLTLAASATLYVLTRALDWNIPQWPQGTWFFNPLAWQVLFVFGAWWATYGGARLWPMIRDHVPVLAIAYLLFSLVVALGWSIEALGALVPEALAKLIYPIDKSGLDPLRLLHFLALAVVVSHFVPRDWLGFAHRDVAGSETRTKPARRDPLAIVLRAAIRCGENSLSIYCFGVVLSLAGGIVLARIDSGIAMQIAVSVAGLVAMGFVASVLTWVRIESRQHPALF